MRQSISKRLFLLAICISICLVSTGFIKGILLKNTKIVFCDVGQGDSIYIRIKNTFDVVIDAGPNADVVKCLSKHMPFYDRTIELAFITHPQKDHYYGFIRLLDYYTIQRIYGSFLDSKSMTYKKLTNKLKDRGLAVKQITAGNSFLLPESQITAYWPTTSYLEKNKNAEVDPNEYSLILLFREGQIKALFTGDATPSLLNRLLLQSELKTNILKIPHHGSKVGLTPEFLMLADPDIAVISVGKNNTYGHPYEALLEMLEANHISIRRTDKEGDIVIELN